MATWQMIDTIMTTEQLPISQQTCVQMPATVCTKNDKSDDYRGKRGNVDQLKLFAASVCL
jgi:hypothetical protein